MDFYRIPVWILGLLALLLCGSVSLPAFAEPRIGVLISKDLPAYQESLQGFRQHLLDRGLQPDYTIKQAGGNRSKAIKHANAIAQENVGLIHCIGTLACDAIHELHQSQPVIASMVLDPHSISHQESATGVFLRFSPRTHLEWLSRLFPKLRRVGVLYSRDQNQRFVEEATLAASQLGLQLVSSPVAAPKELPIKLKYLLQEVDVLWAIPDHITLAPQTAREILLTSFRNRIPVIGPSSSWVRGGALYALDWDYIDIGAQSADMALRSLNGIPVRDIKPAAPRKIEYTLNIRTKEHMRLDVSKGTLGNARMLYQK